MRKIWIFVILLGFIVGLGQMFPVGKAKPPEKTQIMVSAAASLKNSLEEIGRVYESLHEGSQVIFNFGSSGALQQQIENGSPVDLFISAGQKQMDVLEAKGLLQRGTKVNLLGNQLVLITGRNNTSLQKITDLVDADIIHIGIGSPESVPVGMYAKEALRTMKLWDALKTKFVHAKDARQVLAYVMTGNAEAGFVYRSDAAVSDKVKIVESIPAETHQPIVYPAAVIAAGENVVEAENFLKFLQGNESAAIFRKGGFKDNVQEFD